MTDAIGCGKREIWLNVTSASGWHGHIAIHQTKHTRKMGQEILCALFEALKNGCAQIPEHD